MMKTIIVFIYFIALVAASIESNYARFNPIMNEAGVISNIETSGRSLSWTRFLATSSGVLGRYEIGNSTLVYGGMNISMEFQLNDLVPENTVQVTTYSDSACTINITNNTYMVQSLLWGPSTSPDGTKNRNMTVLYQVDPASIKTSPVWKEQGANQYFVSFCVEVALYSGDVYNPSSAQIISVDTTADIRVDLLGNFGVASGVGPADVQKEDASQVYYVEGFICDQNNQEIKYTQPKYQGSTIRVCVKPTDQALADGVFMRSVDSFTFQRVDGGSQITQTALTGGASANPALTTITCVRGSSLCYFDNLLKADFYYSPGTVSGFGEAWLQVGHFPVKNVSLDNEESMTYSYPDYSLDLGLLAF